MKYYSILVLICFCFSCKTVASNSEQSKTGEVKIVEGVFTIPGLNRPRTIRIYTPPGYEQSSKTYPVLYMHDGQNLFEDSTSYAGEWGVDEVLDELSETEGLNLIVVGIDNGGENRIHELTAWDHPQYGKAEGEEYMKFVVEMVKPYVDQNYRTKPDRPNTAIMGGSLGGLISHYAIYRYSEVFSKAGIFSPSYWWGQGPFDQVDSIDLPNDARLNFLMGEKEGESMLVPMDKMVQKVLDRGHPKRQLTSKVNPEGEHNEKFWRSELSEALLWLFKQ